jgi:hypothetical protein
MNDLFASKINFESLQSVQTTEGVKKNVTPNDLAGNVDIASIATTPKDTNYIVLCLKTQIFIKQKQFIKTKRQLITQEHLED